MFNVFSFPETLMRRAWLCLSLSLLAAWGTSSGFAESFGPLTAPNITSVYTTIPSTATAGLPEYGAGTHFYSITWEDKTDNEDFYEIEVQVLDNLHAGASNFIWQHYAYLAPNTTQYFPVFALSSNSVTDTQVQFRVSACQGPVDSSGNVGSAPRKAPSTRSVSYKIPEDVNFPAPSGFQVNVVSGSDGKLHFQWNDNTNKEEGYQLYVSTTPGFVPSGDPKLTFNFGASPPDLALSGLTAGTTYYMKICASRVDAYVKNSSGVVTRDSNNQPVVQSYAKSAFSNEAAVTMPSTLGAPTGLTATPLSENKLRLTWTNHSDNADSYIIQYRYSSGDPFSELGSTGVTQTVDVPGYPGIPTEWQVVAAQAAQGSIPRHVSAASNSATITLPFNVPTELKATFTVDPVTYRPQANLTWTDNSLVEGGYAIFAKPSGSSSDYKNLTVITTPNLTSAQVSASASLLPGTSYEFIVKAYDTNSGKVSGESNPATAISKDGIISLEYVPATYKQPFEGYQLLVSTTISSKQSWSITGLPPGLQFNESGGTVTEVVAGEGPQKAGLFLCPMTVTYANGWVDHKTLALRIQNLNGAPTTPLNIGSRVVGMSDVALPLGEFFADPDTESALRMYTSQGTIDILMQPSLTPATYANFMAYVNGGDYNGTAFHRVSPGQGSPGDPDYSAPFVIQGGGYKPTTAPNNFAGVGARPSPTNEPGIPNVQGTIALAKSSDPDSGTHDFFISLSDNRGILDESVSALDNSRLVPNGGFTAFARIATKSETIATQTAIRTLKGKNTYTINLTPAGSSTAIQDFNPIGDSGLGANTFWPLNPVYAAEDVNHVTPLASPAMDNTLCSVIQSFSPLPVLAYELVSNSNSAGISASIDAQNNLQIKGLIEPATTTIVVKATDLDGNSTTQSFDVTVDSTYVPVSINTQPDATTVNEGSDVSFSVQATGNSLTYQWRKNGEPIANETSSVLTLHNVDKSSIGDYRVAVSNASNLVVSTVAHLNVLLKPVIDTPPFARVVNYNSPVTFSVVASGEGPLSYKWYKDDSLIPGATSASYTINHALLTHAGSYKVVVHNAIADTPSTPVSLTVNQIDSDGDGLYDDVEVGLGLLPNKADTDGDGYNDSLEMSVGTDPRVASSSPGSGFFVSQKDRVAALATMTMKNLPEKLNFMDLLLNKPTDDSKAVTVPQQWFATTEMTNEQFAAVLDIGLRQMNAIEIVSAGGRRYVRYPKTSGQILCYLAPLPSDPPAGNTPASCDIGADETGTTFYVPKTLARKPVRAVSWYGAYFASAALNAYYGYPNKCQPDWTYHSTVSVKGYRIPNYPDWEWAARSGAANYLYPTGGTISPAMANYGNTASTALPKVVGSYAPNKLGLYDMGGNVAEWIFEETEIPVSGYVRGGSFASPATVVNNLAKEPIARNTISDKVGVRLSLTEGTSPLIGTHPQDQFVTVGESVTLSVAATGPPPLTYQWLKNNVVMAGKTASTLLIPAAQLTDAGNYTVKVTTNGAGFAMSNPGGLSVLNSPPTVPTLTVLPNKSATLAVTLAAAPGQVFTYLWTKVSGTTQNLSGATSAKLTKAAATNSDTGSYVCTITPPSNRPSLHAKSVAMDLIVLKVPQLRSNIPGTVSLPTGVVGGYYSFNPFFQFLDPSTDRVPTAYVVKGLPAGMTYNPKTGVITGRPQKTGQTSSIILTASNGVGSVTVNSVIEMEIKPLPAAAVGTFVAGIDPQSSLNGNLGGRLDITCTATGYYTGKITLGGTPYIITGYLEASFNNAGTVNNSARTTLLVGRPGKSSLYLDVTADFATAGFPLTGVLGELPLGSTSTANLVNVAAVTGWRSLNFGGATATTRQGYHTMAFGPPAANTDPTLVPQGTSYLTATVSATGLVTLGGKLADGTIGTGGAAGTVVTGSSVMSSDGKVLVFQSLYLGKGSTYGSFVIADTARHPITAGANGLVWSKNATTDRNYKSGFTPSSLSLALVDGGLYTPPVGVAVLGLSDNQSDNAQTLFSSGGLGSPFVQTFRITSANKTVIKTDTIFNSHSVTFTVAPATGIFNGAFKVLGATTRTAYFWGVITHRKGDASPTKTAGYGYFALPQLLPTTTTSPILSGSVVLQGFPSP